MNAQYAEESYQLKRENCSLKRQIDNRDNTDIDQSVTSSDDNQNPPSFHIIYEELETLRETVNRLTIVSLFLLSKIISDIYIGRKIVVFNRRHKMKSLVYKKK